MSTTQGAAADIAKKYVDAWIAGDVETAMSFVADDIECLAPTGPIAGSAGYREFLTTFVNAISNEKLVDVFGDDEHAVTVYRVDYAPVVTDFRGAEHLTVVDGKITKVISIFDLAPMIQAQAGQQV